MSVIKIPLSHTPFDPEGLQEMLRKYDGKPQTQIIVDFEQRLKEYTGAKYVVAVNSGTAAIHLALQALGVGPGDYVIAPTFTYVATINPILYLGAYPILIDCEPEAWNIDPDLLEEAIKNARKENKKLKCVIVVHNYGMPAQMEEINFICKKYEIPILEDAAEGFGSVYKGKQAGRLGNIGVFSFNNNKTVTTYGGGLLITEDDALYKMVVLWANQSRENKAFYQYSSVGYNYRMGPLNAAAGLLGLMTSTDKIRVRRANFQKYKEFFPLVVWQKEWHDCLSNRWLSAGLFPDCDPLSIVDLLFKAGIEARPLWNPMHLQPVFQSFTQYDRGVALSLFKSGVCFPSGISNSDQDRVINALAESLK